jgi:hypothetical protein
MEKSEKKLRNVSTTIKWTNVPIMGGQKEELERKGQKDYSKK